MLLERRQRALALFDEIVQKGLAAAPSVNGSGSEIVLALPRSRFLPLFTKKKTLKMLRSYGQQSRHLWNGNELYVRRYAFTPDMFWELVEYTANISA
jgi:hypothetical protein